ncbi:hypothetical protein H4S01_000185 [Coemansia sp. RSA 2610]|nr:hypothetical protein H4S01_000185 [Coemansia sp. RSA 2610]
MVVYSKEQQEAPRPANPDGTVLAFDKMLMDTKWRVFSCESEAYINCVLMRRSSYCSLEMRVWHLFSLSTWFDAGTLRSGITLGSLGLQNRGPPSISASYSLVVRPRGLDQAVSESEDADFASLPSRSRKVADLGGQHKTDLLRHRDILQCPWNALAMLFFYKWHVLNEPPPDFDDPTWADQPLFHNDSALRDAHLEQFCGSLYNEFIEGAERGTQQYKYMTSAAYDAVDTALSSSMLLRNSVSAVQNMYVTRRSLQNGHCASIQLANAGFPASKSKAYSVPRQSYAISRSLEEMIFPFADELPRYDDLIRRGANPGTWDAIVGFCNLLKILRTALLQDMAIMFDMPFYRRMLQGSTIMSSDIFHSLAFISSTDHIRDLSWSSDFLPLVESQPCDSRLPRVVPYAAGAALSDSLALAEPPVDEMAKAAISALDSPSAEPPKPVVSKPDVSSKRKLGDPALPVTENPAPKRPCAAAPPGFGDVAAEALVIDLTLDDSDADDAMCLGKQPTDPTSTLLVDSFGEPRPAASDHETAEHPIKQGGDQDQDQGWEQDAHEPLLSATTAVPTPISNAFAGGDDDSGADNPTEATPVNCAPTAAIPELSKPELDRWVEALLQVQANSPADARVSSTDSSASDKTLMATDDTAEHALSAEGIYLRRKAALADVLLEAVRVMSDGLAEVVGGNQSINRKISRILSRQKPDSVASSGLLDTQMSAGGANRSNTAKNQYSMEKLQFVTLRNSERIEKLAEEVEEHMEFMKLAIMQAQMAAPNDRAFNTGVLILSGMQPISSGHSRDPHAPEQHAAASAIAKARSGPHAHLLEGATLYTTMEPCSSPMFAKTPCTTHIVNARIRRVVIGVKEPESFANCRGVDTLCAAGVEVVHLLLLQEECLATNIHLLT